MSIHEIATCNTHTKRQVNFRLPPDIIRQLKSVSEQVGIAQSIIIREALRDKLREFTRTGKISVSE